MLAASGPSRCYGKPFCNSQASLEAAPIGWKLFVVGISLDAQRAVSLFIVTFASRLLARL
jgi:hypothetical protein